MKINRTFSPQNDRKSSTLIVPSDPFPVEFGSSVEPYNSSTLVQIDEEKRQNIQLEIDRIEQICAGIMRVEESNLIPIPQNPDPIGIGTFAFVYVRLFQRQKIAYKKYYQLNSYRIVELLTEVSITKKLDHPNVIKIIGFVNDGSEVGIITKYYESGTLFDRIHNKKTLSDMKICILVKGIIDGMRYLHAQRVVHRDLKSKNILLENDHAVICDFGMSKILEQTNNMSTMNVGSLAYNAPEILRSERYDSKCDVFSFAIVLWEIMHRRIPYEELEGIDIINSVGYANLRPAMKLERSIFTKEVASIIEECWSDIPSERPTFDQLSEKWAELSDNVQEFD